MPFAFHREAPESGLEVGCQCWSAFAVMRIASAQGQQRFSIIGGAGKACVAT